jgi:hypothetical protein
MIMSEPSYLDVLRPRDWALLLLAAGDLRPRQRARDQQADIAGLDLKRRMLDRLAALDPEPAEMEQSLSRLIEELGPPSGPPRAIAISIHEEWQTACATPEFVAFMLTEAIGDRDRHEGGRSGGRIPS